MTTTKLFPEVPSGGERRQEADLGPGAEGRWSLHRAGIVNVWQYDRVELAFAAGRLLLRGKNGAGKSKALEVMLPFLLDGDTRQLDATGRDRTTIAWLMTDGRPSGNHIGYVWLELRLLHPDGSASFLTLGAGLKASTATRRADPWFFITDRRPGIDLDLEVAGESLSLERLKEAVGEDAVATSGAEHRRRVGRRLFGLFDDGRYRNLLHLLHRLRDPNIGNRVEAGELAAVLGDALPPIDERVLTEAAGHFDDLEAIRDQVERAERTALALGQFLGAYRTYTRRVLGERACAVEEAAAGRTRAGRSARRLARAVEEADQAMEKAQAEVESVRRQRADSEAERRELERSEGYRAARDLVDRQERVAALEVAAGEAQAAAALADAAHERAMADVRSASGELDRSLGRTGDCATAAAGLAADAGLDRSLLGAQPAVAGDGQLEGAEVAAAEARSRAARTVAEGRRTRAAHVRRLAQGAEQAQRQAAADEERAAAAEAAVDSARADVELAEAKARAVEEAWVAAMEAWLTTGPASAVDTDWHAVRQRLSARHGEPTWAGAVRRAVSDCLAPPLRRARSAAAAADAAVVAAEVEHAATEARLAEVEGQPEARPAPLPHRTAERDPAGGAPFYELVDVADHVSPSEAAGLEAALQAAGILDAWVHADGLVVHPDTHDVLLDAPPAGSGMTGSPTLADMLVPQADEQHSVSAETVAAVLRSVAVGGEPPARDHSGAWVTAGGRWSLGLLHGAWHKDTLEFLGAGARRATRQRLLEELRRRVEEHRLVVERARGRASAAAAEREALEALPATVPAADAIDDAEAGRRDAERSLAGARARHDDERRRAEAARSVANRLAAAVADEAAADGLPTSSAGIDDVLAAIGELRELLGDHRRALRDVANDLARLSAQRAREAERRAEAEASRARASQRGDDHRTAAHELATLRQALATTVDTVLTRHGQVVARLDELDRQAAPKAEGDLRQSVASQARAVAQLDDAVQAERAAAEVLAEAGRSLAAAVALPGVLLAATGHDDLPEPVGGVPPTPGETAGAAVALAAALAPLVDGDGEMSDGAILSRYDRLNSSLAGGYDTAIDEQEGVKVVHVADDGGRQPLAAVAARLADEAEAAKARLAAREREVLQRFLLRELADEVRAKLLDAHDLVSGTNRTLAGVRTSHGKGAHLEWKLRDDAAGPAGAAARLLVDDLRDEAADEQLRDSLLALIEAERSADPTTGYEHHLRAALDYRSWHRFTIKVTDVAHPGSARTLSSRLGLSQGEQRVLSYLALFAAAAAHFEAIGREAPAAPRLLLLDDAFAKVDEPTHGHLLGLLVQLGLDFVLTSERMWGCFPSVPSLEIYEAVRDPAHPGVALVHFRWDGHQRHLVGV